jgi:transposase-like protein
LDSCEGTPVIVVDRGPWCRWALERLGITYLHETFGNRDRIERLFRELKNRTNTAMVVSFLKISGCSPCEK